MTDTTTTVQSGSASRCKAYLQQRRAEIEKVIWDVLPQPEGFANRLHEAMRYPLASGGKRIRPILVLVGADFCRGVSVQDAYAGRYWNGMEDDHHKALLKVACAIEMIHTYSLIHDDLPCMDDDDLRRGRPTSHIQFGEALAVLSADALLTFGFQLIADIPERFALQAFHVVRELAVASGYPGMVAGQVVDLEYESRPGTEAALDYIHRHKTAALIRTPLLMGACMVDAAPADVALLGRVGERLGLIFQAVDDILDVVGNTELLGKNTGADQSHHKLTFPALFGLEESRKRIHSLLAEIEPELKSCGDRAQVLLDLAGELIQRQA